MKMLGLNCETNILHNRCTQNLCLNNGKCIESPYLQGFVCQCEKNFGGVFCEHSICSTAVCGENGK